MSIPNIAKAEILEESSTNQETFIEQEKIKHIIRQDDEHNQKVEDEVERKQRIEVDNKKEEIEINENDNQATSISDDIEDGFLNPISPDPSCNEDENENVSNNMYQNDDCWNPPQSTIEEEIVVIDATAMYGGDDPSDIFIEDDDDNDGEEYDEKEKTPSEGGTKTKLVDKHWGSDENTLKMRDQLRNAGKGSSGFDQTRPPIFLMPGLASTRYARKVNIKNLNEIGRHNEIYEHSNISIYILFHCIHLKDLFRGNISHAIAHYYQMSKSKIMYG